MQKMSLGADEKIQVLLDYCNKHIVFSDDVDTFDGVARMSDLQKQLEEIVDENGYTRGSWELDSALRDLIPSTVCCTFSQYCDIVANSSWTGKKGESLYCALCEKLENFYDIDKVFIETSITLPEKAFRLFANFSNLREIVGLNKLDFSKCKQLVWLVSACHNLLYLDLSGVHFDNLESMNECFANCDALTYINLDGAVFPKLKYISRCFTDCGSLRELNLSGFQNAGIRVNADNFVGCLNLNKCVMPGWCAADSDLSRAYQKHTMTYNEYFNIDW